MGCLAASWWATSPVEGHDVKEETADSTPMSPEGHQARQSLISTMRWQQKLLLSKLLSKIKLRTRSLETALRREWKPMPTPRAK